MRDGDSCNASERTLGDGDRYMGLSDRWGNHGKDLEMRTDIGMETGKGTKTGVNILTGVGMGTCVRALVDV